MLVLATSTVRLFRKWKDKLGDQIFISVPHKKTKETKKDPNLDVFLATVSWIRKRHFNCTARLWSYKVMDKFVQVWYLLSFQVRQSCVPGNQGQRLNPQKLSESRACPTDIIQLEV